MSTNGASIDGKQRPSVDPITPSAYASYKRLAEANAMIEYKMETQPVSCVGENSYGSVLQVTLIPTRTHHTFAPVKPFVSFLKISPKGDARRDHMKVANYYQREVFMFETVLPKLAQLRRENEGVVDEQLAPPPFDAVPQMYAYSLDEMDEYIIFEDLAQKNYVQNPRLSMPTYDLVVAALEALAQLHARSLVLQHRLPAEFKAITAQLSDNLFTRPMDKVSVEFAKHYIRRTRSMLDQEEDDRDLIPLLDTIEANFEEIALDCVNGEACAPYAVICHGDFWNNNILYNYAPNQKTTSAKLVDFQMSRYSTPVCDLIRYLFTCTEKTLRDEHFHRFLDVYHDSLVRQVRSFGCDAQLYPRKIFDRHLVRYGVYGFVMASFAMPFLIWIDGEFIDLDKISEEIQKLPTSDEKADPDTLRCNRELVEANDLLTTRSAPIFKGRMIGIVRDLVKYKMGVDLLKA